MSIPIGGARGRTARPLLLLSLSLIASATPSSLQAQTPARSPTEIVNAAEDAVSADSDGALRARWSAALQGDSGDREALLGLATLARADRPGAH